MRAGQLRFIDERDQTVATIVTVNRTDTAAERTRGLLGLPALDNNHGLWIEPCLAVHTFGMKYSLDIIYLDSGKIIRKITEQLNPRRLSGCWKARSTLELAAGSARRLQLTPGLKACWTDNA